MNTPPSPGGATNSLTLTINQASLKVAGGSARRTSVFVGTPNSAAIDMTAAATRYHSILGHLGNGIAPTADQTGCPMPFAGSVFAFGVNVTANAAATAGALNLFKNAASSGVSVAVPSATTGWFANTSPGVSFALGDRLGYQWVNGATNTTSIVGFSTTLEADAIASSGGRKRRPLVY